VVWSGVIYASGIERDEVEVLGGGAIDVSKYGFAKRHIRVEYSRKYGAELGEEFYTRVAWSSCGTLSAFCPTHAAKYVMRLGLQLFMKRLSPASISKLTGIEDYRPSIPHVLDRHSCRPLDDSQR